VKVIEISKFILIQKSLFSFLLAVASEKGILLSHCEVGYLLSAKPEEHPQNIPGLGHQDWQVKKLCCLLPALPGRVNDAS